jgi:hypothetical protein
MNDGGEREIVASLFILFSFQHGGEEKYGRGGREGGSAEK